MEFNAIVKIVPKKSKQGNPYNTLEIYVDGKLVKSGVFLTDAEKTLLEILG